MKQLNLFILFLICAASLTLIGCSDDDKPNPIVVDNTSSLTQDVYADKTEGHGVSFATTGPWTSSIKTVTPTRDGSSSTAEWVKLNPSSGSKAGNYTVAIELEPNTTGTDRSATISILCEGSEIAINVTQKATKEDGKVMGKTITFKVLSCNEEWNPDKNIPPCLPAEGAEVKVYKADELIGTYTTNQEGIATAELEDGEYTYKAIRENESNISGDEEGYLLAGLITTRHEAEILNSILGAAKVKDVNGDGIVDAKDKVKGATIRVVKDEEVEVYIAALDFMPAYSPDLLDHYIFNMEQAYGYMINESYYIDGCITQELKGKTGNNSLMDFTFEATSSGLYNFWNQPYAVIRNANVVLEKSDIVFGLSDSERDSYRAKAKYHRMYAYSVLLNYFGEVPIYTNSTFTFKDKKKSTVQEVVNFIFDDGDVAREHGQYRDVASQVMARVAINKGDFVDAYPLLEHIRKQIPTDIEMDWGVDAISDPVLSLYGRLFEKQPNNPELFPVRYTETALLFAEAALGVGDISRALSTLQEFTQVNDDEIREIISISAPTPEGARYVINFLWKKLLDREGHTFAQLKRSERFFSTLGQYGAKDKHLLLPIPASVVNENITQNPGW